MYHYGYNRITDFSGALMKHRTLAIALGVSALIVFTARPLPFVAQERIDADINAKIAKKAQDNSKILRTMHYLTDVCGPRLTGSPNLKAAGEWAVKEMASWGFTNGHLEPWDFARPGWIERRRHRRDPLAGQGQARVRGAGVDAGTDGTVKAKAFNIITPDRPTKEELEKYLESVKAERRRTPSSSWDGPGRCRSTSSRRPSERRTTWLRGRFNGAPGAGPRWSRRTAAAVRRTAPREGAR